MKYAHIPVGVTGWFCDCVHIGVCVCTHLCRGALGIYATVYRCVTCLWGGGCQGWDTCSLCETLLYVYNLCPLCENYATISTSVWL